MSPLVTKNKTGKSCVFLTVSQVVEISFKKNNVEKKKLRKSGTNTNRQWTRFTSEHFINKIICLNYKQNFHLAYGNILYHKSCCTCYIWWLLQCNEQLYLWKTLDNCTKIWLYISTSVVDPRWGVENCRQFLVLLSTSGFSINIVCT